MMNADGTGQIRLTTNFPDDYSPSWQPFLLIGTTAGSPVSRTMTIENKGDATLNVSNIISSDGQFTISPTSFSVNAGTSQNVTVTFIPTSAGTKYSTLTISSNDPDAPTVKMTVNATATGVAPTITDIADQTVNEDMATSVLVFTVGDVETTAASLTVSGNSSNTTLVPNASIVFGGSGVSRTVTVIPAANQSGSTTITVTVSDGSAADSDTFTLTVNAVNDAPTLAAVSNPAAINEDAGAQTVNLSGIGAGGEEMQTLSVMAVSNNTSLILNPTVSYTSPNATGSLSYMPVTNAGGSATIRVSVTDDGGTVNGGINTISQSFTVIVNPVNDPPTISDITDQTVDEDKATAALPFKIKDVETAGNGLTLSKTSSNIALVPLDSIVFGGADTSRTVTVTPAANQSGSATITVTVSDGSLTASDTFTLTVNAVNDAPTITDIANVSTKNSTPTTPIEFTVDDAETAAASLTLTGTSSNPTLVPNASIVFGGSGANRTVTLTPAANQSGTATITLTVSDGSLSASDTFVLTVSDNSPPTITDIADQTINEDTATSALSFTVGDVETAVASLVLSKSSSNTVLVPADSIKLGGTGANRTVTISPAANQNGFATISLTVSDGAGTTTKTFLLTVTSVNDVPVFTPVADQSLNEGSKLSLTLKATDIDNDPLTFSLSSPPAGASLVKENFLWVPSYSQAGIYTLIFSVSDSKGGIANDTVRVEVKDAAPPALTPSPTPPWSFDDVPAGTSTERRFYLKNPDALTARLDSLVTRPGAFSVVSPARGDTIRGNDSLAVTLRFKPLRLAALQTDTLRVFSSAGKVEIPLSGRGTWVGLAVAPDTLDFGKVKPQTTQTRTFTVSDPGNLRLEITGTTSSNPAFSAQPKTFNVDPSGSQTVTVTFAPTQAGAQSGTLTLSSNADSSKVVRLRGQGAVGPIAVLPARLDFNRVPMGSIGELNLVVTNTGDDTLRVLSVLSDKPVAFNVSGTLPLVVAPSAAQGIGVRFTPQAVGKDSSELTLSTNAGLPQRVRLVGTGTPRDGHPPTLRYSPADTLRFGVVGPNQSELQPVVFRNSGSGILKVVLISESEEFVPEEQDTIQVEADQTHTTLIRFEPARTGTRRANLLIFSNDPQQPLTTLVMQGSGGDLYFDPPSIVFGEVQVGVKKDTTVVLVNQTANALMVRLNLPPGDFSVDRRSARIDVGKNVVLKISFRPSHRGQQVVRLEVQGRDLGLELAGTGEESVVLEVSARNLTMDNTRVRQTSRKTLTVRNTSSQRVLVTLALSGPDANQFRVAPRRQTLAPGQRRSLTLTFAPTSAGAKRAILTITPSTGSPLTVALTGTAVAATARGLSARPDQKNAQPEAAKPVGNADLIQPLGNNYPNPFNAQTVIRYQLPEVMRVELAIYDVLGQRVRVLVEGVQGAGRYEAVWEGRDERGMAAASGLYFYRLQTGNFHVVKKMLLVR